MSWLNDKYFIPFSHEYTEQNQSIVSRNYIKNEALVSTVDFRVNVDINVNHLYSAKSTVYILKRFTAIIQSKQTRIDRGRP